MQHKRIDKLTRYGFDAGKAFFQSRFLNKRIPLAIAMELTHRCNLRCPHCYASDRVEEVDRDAHISIIRQVRENGCRFLSLTGGEPLLVDHFPELVKHAHENRLWVQYTTNGLLLPDRKIEIAKDAPELVQISLDGDREVHEASKGKSTYDRVMAALDVVAENRWRCLLLSVMGRNTTPKTLLSVIEQAMRVNGFVSFQPLCDLPELGPTKEQLNAFVDFLLLVKSITTWKDFEKIWDQHMGRPLHKDARSGPWYKPLNQSGIAINYLRRFPDNAFLNCIAGKIMGRIRPDSQLVPCYYAIDHESPRYILEEGFALAWENLNEPRCNQCWHHHRLELALMYNLSLKTMKEVLLYHFG